MKPSQVLPFLGFFGLAISAPLNSSSSSTPGPVCRDLMIPVTATANNTLLPAYPNSTSPTAFYEYFGSLNFSAIPEFTNTISGTFNISASYCEPTVKVEGRNAVQLLVHRATALKSYWSGLNYPQPEFASQYSWVDHARSQEYATLAIDRLGNGESSHPDPLNVAQGPLQVEIIHQLIQSLRNGTLPTINHTYSTVILGSHSYGSILGRSLATLHPTTGADAYIFTALISNLTGFFDALATFQARAASQVNPFEFSNLPQGYVGISTPSIRDSFYSSPSDFSAGILAYDQVLPHIFAAGEVIAQAPLESSPSNFTGPVMVVTGRYDQIVCGVGNFTKLVGDCGVGETSIPAGTKVMFPKARNFKAYTPDRTGHNINTHYTAGESFGAVHQWLEDVGF